MSTATNKGSQDVFFQYEDPLTAVEFDAKDVKIAPLGIYDGALLLTVDNSTVTVSAWTAIISDGTYVVTARAAASYDVTGVNSTNRNIVLRWTFSAQNVWYVDVLAVSDANIQPYDLVIGRVVYSGLTIVGYNYSTRSEALYMAGLLKVIPTNPASMKVQIRGGIASYGSSKLAVPTQQSATFTAPTTNPRIDLVYIDTSGAIQIATGVEAASPSAPSYAGKIVLAEITLTVGMSSIAASNISDARAFLSGVSSLNFMDLTTDQTAAGIKSFQGGIEIERRTSDPSSPNVGRVWLRTDL